MQTNNLSLLCVVCIDDMRLDDGGGFEPEGIVMKGRSSLNPAASAVSTTFTTAMVLLV